MSVLDIADLDFVWKPSFSLTIKNILLQDYVRKLVFLPSGEAKARKQMHMHLVFYWLSKTELTYRILSFNRLTLKLQC